jgi:hypothetical protein
MTISASHSALAQRVAARTGVAASHVEGVMATHGVAAVSTPAARRSMRVLRLRITGTKDESAGGGAFDRSFAFPAGISMVIGSNFVGKTSVLEVITWCLRGAPRELQPDVAAWLESVECDVEVNGRALGIRLRLHAGDLVTGTVHEAATVDQLDQAVATARPLVSASAQAEYADAVQGLMLDRLSLEPLHAHDRKNELTQRHGWPTYFGAIYPPAGGDKILIGETAMAGLAGRLLKVFLDLPRAAVLTRVQAARDGLRTSMKKAGIPGLPDLQARQQTALTTARSALAALPSASALSATDAADRVRALAARLALADERWAQLGQAFRLAKAARQADDRALTSQRETVVATQLFHGLNPSSCPRCEAPVTEGRRVREDADHVCAVCTTPLLGDEDEAADLIAERQDALTASTAAETAALAALERAETEVNDLTAQLAAAQAELAAAEAARQVGDRARLELEVARAEGALAVLAEADPRSLDDSEEDTGGPQGERLLAVLEALVVELEQEQAAESEDLIEAVGDEIAELARTFGMTAVTGAKIRLNGTMLVDKGGVTGQTFSSQSAGGRLRLRIATIIALLRVGARRGVATHPGLLMLDSLRAEEVQDDDAHEILDALIQVADETPGLQIITTTADQALPDGRLDADHVLRPVAPDAPLW